MQSKNEQREHRHKRIRAKVKGTEARPRLAVFKSNRAITVQLINDDAGRTLMQAHSREVEGKNVGARARAIGKLVAGRAKEKGVAKVVFDRGGYRYAGAIQAVAEGAREGGLAF